MEKIIVKNFGPIKEAEIDLTKYVVFIGDTSTGKSVLAKLIAIFRDSLIRYPNNISEMELRKDLIRYNIDFDFDKTDIEYSNDDYKVRLLDSKLSSNKQVIDENTKVFIANQIKSILKNNPNVELGTDIDTLISNTFLEMRKRNLCIYIPAERIINSLIGSSSAGLWANNIALPECIKDFAARYEVAKNQNKKIEFKDFGFDFIQNDGSDYVKISNEQILLSQSSSGILSLVPLLMVLEHEMNSEDIRKVPKTILLEEPELNLFPIKQKLLIEYVIDNVFRTKYKLLITTHSPYILSVLDTLILAKNTFDEHPDLENEIDAIISKDKWIDYNDLSIYEVRNDGTIKSIKNDEFRSIDTNAIDRVSNTISEEFDKLTELRYAQ